MLVRTVCPTLYLVCPLPIHSSHSPTHLWTSSTMHVPHSSQPRNKITKICLVRQCAFQEHRHSIWWNIVKSQDKSNAAKSCAKMETCVANVNTCTDRHRYMRRHKCVDIGTCMCMAQWCCYVATWQTAKSTWRHLKLTWIRQCQIRAASFLLPDSKLANRLRLYWSVCHYSVPWPVAPYVLMHHQWWLSWSHSSFTPNFIFTFLQISY